MPMAKNSMTWLPQTCDFGVGIVRADMGNGTRRRMRALGLAEVPQFSEAVQKCLSIAAADLERGGGGDLIAGAAPTVHFERIVGAGLQSHVRMIGTALRRFEPADQADVLSILRLSDRSRPQE